MSTATMMKSLSLVVLASTGIMLTGCNKTSTTSQTNAATSGSSTAPTAATSATPTNGGNTLKVSITSNTPPFAFMNEKGSPQGIDVDMINEVAKLEGFNVQYVPTSWDGMFTDIENGKSDIAVSGISFTPERNEKYGVSKSYYFNPSSIVYQAGKGNYQVLDDLQGKRVAGLSGGKSKQYAQSVKNAQLTTDETPFLLYQQVVKDKADAAIYDQPVWTYLAKQYPQFKVNVVPLEKQDDPNTQTVVVTAKNKTELLAKINDGISKLQQQGKLAQIEQKYMGSTEGTKMASTSGNGAVAVAKPL